MKNPLEQEPKTIHKPILVSSQSNNFCGCLKDDSVAGGEGSTTFLGLLDTPKTYVGQIGKVVVVNEDGTGLAFTILPPNVNVYNSDGDLTGDRTVGLNGHSFNIQDNDNFTAYLNIIPDTSGTEAGGQIGFGANDSVGNGGFFGASKDNTVVGWLSTKDGDIKTQSIQFSSTDGFDGMIVYDERNQRGLENQGDYEANFVARSLITKQYLESFYGFVPINFTDDVIVNTVNHNLTISSDQSLDYGFYLNALADNDGSQFLIQSYNNTSPFLTTEIGLTQDEGHLSHNNNGSLFIYSTTGEITDSINNRGIFGTGYYGANYTDNTYVQKKFITDGYLPLTGGVLTGGLSLPTSDIFASGFHSNLESGTAIYLRPENSIGWFTGGSFEGDLKIATQTNSHSWFLPDKDGTIAMVSDITSTVAGYLALTGGTLTGDVQQTVSPVNGNSLITKSYVDNAITGLTWKKEVKASTTVNITLSGTQTVDGIALIAADRILVKNQTTASQNGIYAVAAGAWTRTTDADTTEEIEGATVMVRLGTVNKDTQWTNTNSNEPVIGTDPITFGQISGAGTYTNGTGILLSSNVFSLDRTYTDGLYGSLQLITNGTGNNITSNAIQISGSNNISASTNSMIMYYAGGAAEIQNIQGGVAVGTIAIKSQSSGAGGAGIVVSSRISGIDAITNDELTTLGQQTTAISTAISGVPSNYITTNTTQTGLTGNKTSTGTYTLGQLAITGTSQFTGNIGHGAAPATAVNFLSGKQITGSTTAYGFRLSNVIQSDVTGTAFVISSEPAVQAASFTLGNLYHFRAIQGTFGAGSTVTNQYGFQVSSNLIGATNNYGFYGQIGAGTGMWNLFMTGTAANYLAGQTSIGNSSLTIAGLYVATPGVGTTLVRGTSLTQTLAATANNTSTIALELAPTFTNPGTGVLTYNTLVAGSGYANGTFNNITLTGGTGTGVTANITVAGGVVTNVFINTTNGTGYTIGDVLSANASFDGVGSGSGFSITVATIGFSGITNYAIRSTSAGWTQLGGNLGIGGTPLAYANLYLVGAMTGNTTAYGIHMSKVVQSDVPNLAVGYNSSVGTQATSFTLTILQHFAANQGAVGAGSTITNQYGFIANNSLIGATNNYGFRGAIPVGTGRYNIYMDGTAQNYMAGNFGIGTGQTTPTSLLQVGGSRSLAAWSTTGPVFSTAIGTYTDNSTSASTIITNAMMNSFAIPTIAATNTGVTYTNAATVYINGAAAAGTNVTITNPYALYVAAGTSFFGGNIRATLPVYSTGTILQAVYNSTNNRFETLASLALSSTTMSLTANTTLTAANFGPNGHLTIYASAGSAFTITLPTAATWGSASASLINYVLYVVKTDASANTVTVKGNGSELINGINTDTTLSTQYASNTYQSNGTQIYKF